MIGYSLGDTTIGVEYMPPRIKPCLAIQKGNVLTKVASFNDQYSATIFLYQLADFVHAQRIDWVNDESLPVGMRIARGWKWAEDAELSEVEE